MFAIGVHNSSVTERVLLPGDNESGRRPSLPYEALLDRWAESLGPRGAVDVVCARYDPGMTIKVAVSLPDELVAEAR